ncbi:MAG: cell division protein SepF [Bacilli bacterium]|nr:cell division protein SepF [Bacilli bacterium]
MGMDKLKGFFGGTGEPINNNGNETNENEFYETQSFADSSVGSKMILFEPRAYSESQQIADYLKKRNAVVVNLKRVTPDQAKRIVDFLSGTLYAINGGLQKLGTGIFLCTPNNVDVEGSITDEVKEKITKKEKDDDKNEEEVDW